MSEADFEPEVISELVDSLPPPPTGMEGNPVKPCGFSGADCDTNVLANEMAEAKSWNPDHDKAELVGLAFSGGGIRSATFGLGVLEALKEHKKLKRFDYLSSVSGGGYISAWFSANCKRRPGWIDQCWKESTDHLRRFSNYLSPQVGFFSADTWSMLMVWVRNALLIQATIILAIALLLMLPRGLFLVFSEWSQTGWPRMITVFLFTVAVVGVCANLIQLLPSMRTRQTGTWSFAASGWLRWTIVSMGWFGLAVLLAKNRGFNPFTYGPVDLIAYPIGILGLISAFAAVPLVLKFVELLRTKVMKTAQDMSPEVNYGQGEVQRWIVLPLIATSFLLSSVMWGMMQHAEPSHGMGELKTYGELVLSAGRYWPFPLALAFISFLLISACSLRAADPEHVPENSASVEKIFWKAGLVMLVSVCCSVVLHLLLCIIALLMSTFKGLSGGVWHAFVWGAPLVLFAFAISITLLIGLVGRASIEGMREWWSRLAAWLCIYGAAWGLVNVAAVYGPLAVGFFSTVDDWKGLGTSLGWILATVGSLFAANSAKSDGETKIRSEEPTRTSKIINGIAVLGPYIFIAGLLIGVATALEVVLWKISGNAATHPMSLDTLWSQHWPLIEAPGNWTLLAAGVVLLIALVIMAARVGVNEFSLNAFYRNRLVRCYLGATRDKTGTMESSAAVKTMRNPQRFTNFDEDDDMPMSELAGGSGPFHLVNCALNLGGSSDLSLHTRHSASFTISPTAMGSSHLVKEGGDGSGYKDYSGISKEDQVTLGQAISVSGAAASPNMGYHTSPAVAFLLTVFNVRLGWWFPNPVATAKDLKASPLFSLRYLLLELFGIANEKLNYLMVSDGGHFENLGVYELVRRKCKLIVASDAECDLGMQFGGLGALIRMCEVDFGARITIDTSAFAFDATTRQCKRRFVVGEIKYSDDTEGVLIYLKASMDGTEDASVRQYRASHSTFPHESTGDQFYGEDQFESYRRLGRAIAFKAFAMMERNEGECLTLSQAKIFADVFKEKEPKRRAA